MTIRFALSAAAACLMLSTAPAVAEDFKPSDTYHVNDLHCAVGGAAACARPADQLGVGRTGSVALPVTPSATEEAVPAGANGVSTLSNAH